MKLRNSIFSSSLMALILMSSNLDADVSGTVFRDLPVNGTTLNTYGVKDSNEIGIKNIVVTGYQLDGGTETTLTGDDGSWTLATTGNVRVEFSGWAGYLQESSNGGVKNSSTQFIQDGGTANFGLHNPADYINNNVEVLAVTVSGGTRDANPSNPTLRKFTYSESSQNIDESGVVNIHTVSETGNVWGLAYNSSTKRAYSSASLRRHVDISPDGLGAIYVTDLTDSLNPVTSLFTTVPNAGTVPDATARNLSSSNYASHDIVMSEVGNVGLGDTDISEDGRTLYTINLATQELVEIDIATKAQTNHSIANPFGANCPDGDVRSWAVEPHDGLLYIGSVCSTNVAIGSAVSQWDGSSYTTILTTPLDYVKQKRLDWDGEQPNDNWGAWLSDSTILFNGTTGTGREIGQPQPILSDIIFTENNGMVLGLNDRLSLLTGYDNYAPDTADTTLYEQDGGGDILRVCKVAGVYYNEGDVNCPSHTNKDGNNEYFLGDTYDNSSSRVHNEIALGGILYKQGSGHVVSNSYDPNNLHSSDGYNRSGVTFFDMNTGEQTGGQLLNGSGTAVGPQYGLAKTGGMGDIELLSDPAPIEIGDRVWEDTNSNGVQDADEIGISGVTVELVCGGAVASTATTDADGNYIFSNDPSGTTTSSHRYNVASLVAGSTECLVRVPNVTGDLKQSSLGIASLTVANVGEGSNANSNDSDGVVSGNDANASILPTDIPLSGANNHSFDFGFSPKPIVSIGSLVWEDLNSNGLQDDDESGIADVNVTLLDENGTVMSNPVQKTLATGQYYFSGLDEGNYSILVSPPTGMGYIPCATQNTTDNDDTQNDSNIKEPRDGGYVSGQFTLEADSEPVETEGKSGTDDADDGDDDNGNMTVDFCFYRPASLGDYVWYDDNKDGIQDVTERAVPDVNVTLFKNCGSRETLIKRIQTNIEGKYLFTNLEAGDYCVEFSNLPADYMITTQGSGTSDDSDVNVDTNRTATITLDVGEEDLTWDMGIYSSKVAIGDRVWYDSNKDGQQDATEVGVNGVDVILHDSTCNNELNRTITSGDGNYIFESLRAGTYCLEFSGLESGYVISPQNNGDDTSDSDVNATTKKTVAVTLEEGTRDLTWDMGIYQPATLGDKVWNDKNANGIQDRDELPVAGVDVVLLGSDCATAVAGVDPQTTADDGLYLFTDLLAGDYCVEFTNIPLGYAITPPNKGTDDSDSDVNITTGKTALITLNAGDDDRTWDMGIYEEASIGNYVWNDINGNGTQDDSEVGVENVTVTLYNADCRTMAIKNDGSTIPVIKTDANGLYKFEHLMPNEYCLGFTTLPNGFQVTSLDSTEDNNDSDVIVSSMKTISTLLLAGENDMSWDMGIYLSATIGDRVWYDTNANGVQEDTESGVKDVSVKLYQSDCRTLAVDGLNNPIPTVITDSNGSYMFTNLVPNHYCVGFDLATLPAGSRVSPKNVNTTTVDKDSNADENGFTESTDLIGGETDTSWDMGIYRPATIGNFVWLDSNANGVQDVNEGGVANVTVRLYAGDCTTAVTTDSDGVSINPVITGSNGFYEFNNLKPANYCVGFDNIPLNHRITRVNEGDDLRDSDVNPVSKRTISTQLVSGENDPSWDMGIYAPASIGDKVWLDTNANGVQDSNESGVKNVEVRLYKSDCSTAVRVDDSGNAIAPIHTDENGIYKFTNLTPNQYCIGFTVPLGYFISSKDIGTDNNDSDVNIVTSKTVSTTLTSGENDISWDMGIYKLATIGDKVWNDHNGDGQQDIDEEGVSNVTVTLYNCDCVTVATDNNGVKIPNTLTDENGLYRFTELKPSNYCVGFTIPSGYTVSPQNSGDDDAKDSDVNIDTNVTKCTTLSSDENDTSWDMGIYIPASIGDRVWFDENRNGIQESTESGIENVKVTLFSENCTTQLRSMQTGKNGNYLFSGLVPSDYCLGFEVPNGYAITLQNATEDTLDSDVNEESRTTVVTTLESGENDTSWDMGLYLLSTIGDYVWYDENKNGLQDEHEQPVEDVKVVLYESDCETAISETRSDVSGHYSFVYLEPKEYCVGFEDLPIGYQFTPNTQEGNNTEYDCDVDPGTGKTDSFDLPPSTIDNTWDMGIIPKCKDEEGRVLQVFSDEVVASTTGAITTINILENDHGNLDIESIQFLSTTEGAILWENGTAVGGTSVETSDTLVVEGEGVWSVELDGTITFKAENGFTGIPSPVYYVVKCKQGNTSNVGQVRIVSNCVCDTYEESISDSVPSLNYLSILFVIFSISMLGSFLVRHEFED